MKRHLGAEEGVFIIAILLTFLVCLGFFTAEETLPTPEEIIAKNIEAMGGRVARKNVYNIKTVDIYKIVQTNEEIKDIVYREGNNLYQSADTGVRSGSNGKIAWVINPYSGTRLLEGDELSKRLSAAKFDGLDRPDLPYKSMKTEGIERINGKDCYKVVKGAERIVYYDIKSFLKVNTINYFKGPPMGNNKSETYIEEYQKIDNILFPYKEVQFLNGRKHIETTHEKIELNIEMPEGIFDIPEEVKAIMDKK